MELEQDGSGVEKGEKKVKKREGEEVKENGGTMDGVG